MLTAELLGKQIGKRKILSDISLSLAPGETIAILGPSGSGKTTLLRLLLGLDTPDSGSVRWNDEELSAPGRLTVPTERRGFGLVFQDAALFPHLNVSMNIGFALDKLPKAERLKRVRELAEPLSIENLLKRNVADLSGGERQRVALARTLASEPRALFLDEPFSNVDRLTRQQLIATLRDVFRNRNTAVAIVTHDARDAQELAHRVVLMKEGRVVQTGSIKDLMESPANPWVAEFLASGIEGSNLHLSNGNRLC